jgi:hypothetical protein
MGKIKVKQGDSTLYTCSDGSVHDDSGAAYRHEFNGVLSSKLHPFVEKNIPPGLCRDTMPIIEFVVDFHSDLQRMILAAHDAVYYGEE